MRRQGSQKEGEDKGVRRKENKRESEGRRRHESQKEGEE